MGTTTLPSLFTVTLTPGKAFELLFFSIFGQTRYESLAATFVFDEHYRDVRKALQPVWTLILFKVIFGVYIIVSNIVLVNLLIAMMTDTYQRIQVKV